MKSEKEIEDQIDEASLTEDNTRYPGMNYEEGVKYALEWVMRDDVDKPMEDD